jgi:cytochrome c553
MKLMKLTVLVLAIAMALFIMLPNLSRAEDGGAIYKAKCAACHAPDGAGIRSLNVRIDPEILRELSGVLTPLLVMFAIFR